MRRTDGRSLALRNRLRKQGIHPRAQAREVANPPVRHGGLEPVAVRERADRKQAVAQLQQGDRGLLPSRVRRHVRTLPDVPAPPTPV